MVAGSRNRKFARAALNVAVELDAAAPFVERFTALAGLFRSNRAFRQLLITTRVPPDRKVAALRRALGEQLSGHRQPAAEPPGDRLGVVARIGQSPPGPRL